MEIYYNNKMRLSDNELEELEIAHRKAKSKKEADKIKSIILWNKGYKWETIKEVLLISDGTIKNYVDAYQNGGLKELLETRYEGHNFKLTKEEEEILCKYVENNNIQSSVQACDYVRRRFGKVYTKNGMTKTLKPLGFSYKKPKAIPCKVDSFAQVNFLIQYYQKKATQKKDEAIYFVDASGFQHNAKLDYGWIRKGWNKEVKSNSGRKKINVNGAYNPITHEVITVSQEGNMNTESNIALIKKIIEYNHWKSEITLFVDNAKMNKSKNLKDFIKKQKVKITLVYLPPYSPNLYLIERLWRLSKKKLLSNKYYSSFMKFKISVEDFFDEKIWRMKKELKSLMKENFQLFGLQN